MNKFVVNLLDNAGNTLDSFVEFANFKYEILDTWGAEYIQVIDLGELTNKQLCNSLKAFNHV